MKKIAVYSGTFDPVHLGHTWLINYCLERQFDEVVVLVEPEPRQKRPLAPLSDRIAMLKAVYSNEPRVSVNPLSSQDNAYTIKETLSSLEDYAPGAEIHLVMGGDVFEYVPRWEDIESALPKLKFVVALRSEDDGEIAVATMQKHMNVASVHLVPSQHSGISSTNIRRSLALGEPSEAISQEVAEYIEENGLYAN